MASCGAGLAPARLALYGRVLPGGARGPGRRSSGVGVCTPASPGAQGPGPARGAQEALWTPLGAGAPADPLGCGAVWWDICWPFSEVTDVPRWGRPRRAGVRGGGRSTEGPGRPPAPGRTCLVEGQAVHQTICSGNEADEAAAEQGPLRAGSSAAQDRTLRMRLRCRSCLPRAQRAGNQRSTRVDSSAENMRGVAGKSTGCSQATVGGACHTGMQN